MMTAKVAYRKKVFHDRICAAYFSSISERLDLAEENSDSKLSNIFFLACCRKFILCPIPLETGRYGNLKMKKCATQSIPPRLLTKVWWSVAVFTTCLFGRGFSRGRFESTIPHSCLGLSAAPDLHRSSGAQSIIIRKAFNDFVNS